MTVTREDLGEAGQPTPRARIRLAHGGREARDDLTRALRSGRPRIDLLPDDHDGVYVAPETLLPGEEVLVTGRLGDLLDEMRGAG